MTFGFLLFTHPIIVKMKNVYVSISTQAIGCVVKNQKLAPHEESSDSECFRA
jgi:hypothetical protein